MPRDDTKLNYFSGWDIDQLYATNTLPAIFGKSLVYTIPLSLPVLPEYEVQFKPTGDTKWYQIGSYATANTLATLGVTYTYIENGAIYLVSTGGTARYFIWTDKVNY